MKELIEYVINHLVDEPAEVHVEEFNGERTAIYELHVNDEDMGKVIGKKGQTVNSLRTILAVASAKQGKRPVLEIMEANGMERKESQFENSAPQITSQTAIYEHQPIDEIHQQDNGGNNR